MTLPDGPGELPQSVIRNPLKTGTCGSPDSEALQTTPL
jgi:hypothetical protein